MSRNKVKIDKDLAQTVEVGGVGISTSSRMVEKVALLFDKTKPSILASAAFATLFVFLVGFSFAARPADTVSTAPVLLRPSNGVSVEAIPEFDWEGVRGASGYELQYTAGTDTSFSNATIVELNRNTTSYRPESFAEGDYLWRVRAEAKRGNVGPWSDSWTFSYQLAMPAPDPTPEPEPDPTPDPTACGGLSQEAEDALLSGAFVVNSSSDASGGQYVVVPEGTVGTLTTKSDNYVQFCFNVTEAASYNLLGTVRTPNSGSDSFLYEVNNDGLNSWWLSPSTSFYDDVATGLDLVAGEYTVIVYLREDGAQLDKLSLVKQSTTAPDPTPEPDPEPDPTPDPSPTTGQVIWTAGHEISNPWSFSEWTRASNSGTWDLSRDCNFARTGSCSARAEIGSSGGVRLVYQGHNLPTFSKTNPENLPTDATYSAWYYIPEYVQSSWWNIFQWKQGYQTGPSSRTAREMYWMSVQDSNNQLSINLHSRIDSNGVWDNTRSVVWARSTTPLPIGEWFKIESRYVWDKNGNGRITTWLNDQQLWDVTGLYTEATWPFYEYNREWTANNYGSGMNPNPYAIWIDDAAVTVPN